MPYSAFQPQTHRPSGQGLGLCSIHCPRASRLGREGYAAWCLTQPRPSSRVEGAAPLSRPRSNAAARWVKKPLMRIRGARGRRCGGPVLGPSCLMYTWLHAGSPVGASPAACEPEGKRQGPYLKACGRTDGPASYQNWLTRFSGPWHLLALHQSYWERSQSQGTWDLPWFAELGDEHMEDSQREPPPPLSHQLLPCPACALRKYHHQWAVHGGRGGRNLSGKKTQQCFSPGLVFIS